MLSLPAVVVGDPDVQLPVEAAEAAQGRIDGVGPARESTSSWTQIL